MESRRLFIDMDGTLAEFKPTKKLEDLYEQGYFINLKPFSEVVEAVKQLYLEDNNIEVFILSAVLSDSQYALQEKQEWLDQYLPEIDSDHRVFCACGTDKKLAVPDGIRVNDFLLDDYTANLKDWEPPAIGIKILNGINDTNKSWQGERVTRFQEPEMIKNSIEEYIDTMFPIESEPEL